ncbi:hypothetical protein DID75_03495 [Candidatus Marinamargulisbacteria bacterium SCGC AG-410-N11]|nr:hypothetical protein DID75_03495 [Candidatus Marinamargulisbacteria bacterium SCGC AG-410-N11]
MKRQLSTKCIFTVAFKEEIDCDWFKQRQIPIITWKSIQSEGFDSIPDSQFLVIITGMGEDNSTACASFINTHLSPYFVINIGTCGSNTEQLPLHQWVIPDILSSNGYQDITLTIPSTLFDDTLRDNIQLWTISKDHLHDHQYDAQDMEAYFQAKVFKETNCSFFCLKFITDQFSVPDIKTFKEQLHLCRKTLPSLLSWIDRQLTAADIAVIIPAYNRDQHISKAIQSVLNQTQLPGEIIVVDDGSSDNTVAIIKERFPSVKLIQNKNNQGVSASRNLGVSSTQLPWIAFLDSDDEWLPSKLEDQCLYLNQHPIFQIVQSNEKWIYNGKHKNQKDYHQKSDGWIWDVSLDRCMISPSSVLMKRSLFNYYGGFNIHFLACEDYDLWLKIAREHPVGLENTINLIKYGGHSDQLSVVVPALDRFRVDSLFSLYKPDDHSPFQIKLQQILIQKIDILINGLLKRGRSEQALYYRNLRSQVTVLVH